MPIHSKEHNDILEAVQNSQYGADVEGVSKLLEAKGVSINRRTLQRRLSELVAAGKIVTQGKGRALRYISASFAQRQRYASFSTESKSILEYVSQPKHLREATGYRFEFLEQYQPNISEYVPGSLKKQLLQMGMSAHGDLHAGTFARDILGRLLIDLSWASSRLEGNTYSRLDTQNLIEFGQTAVGKDATEAKMILNHKAAIEFIVNEAEYVGFNSFTIFNLHSMLSDGLLPNPQDSGRLRMHPVEIGGSTYLPMSIPQKIEECFRLVLDKASAIRDPFEQSFFAMTHLAYLQPFMDVNKRVSRLAANIPLVKKNLSPLSFVDIPEQDYVNGILGVYELNRVELLLDAFVWGYEKSCQQYVAIKQTLVEPNRFRLKYRQQLSEAIRMVVENGLAVKSLDDALTAVPPSIPQEDRDEFAGVVLDEMNNLYEGNIARFGIRLPVFTAWKNSTMQQQQGLDKGFPAP